jgi:hypothetical protein
MSNRVYREDKVQEKVDRVTRILKKDTAAYQEWRESQGRPIGLSTIDIEKEVASNHNYGLTPIGRRTYGQRPRAYVTCNSRCCNKEATVKRRVVVKKPTDEERADAYA